MNRFRLSSLWAHRARPSTLASPFRLNRTYAPPPGSPSPASGTTSTATLVGLAAVASGILGYWTAQTSTPARSSSPRSLVTTKNVSDNYGDSKALANALAELGQALEKTQVSTNADVLLDHGSSPHHHHNAALHHVVVYPRSTEDVVKIVNISRKYRIPVVPYGAATSLEGHVAGLDTASICIDMSEMTEILEVHADDADLVCQAGAGWDQINHHLDEMGLPLFFPIDPGPSASVGGMMSTGCSGTNAVRYGTARGEWFLNATVVLPSGEVIKTRRRARKSSSGFDTTKLFIGAEGTLGIITEVTIRLAPRLPSTVAVAQFPNVKSATEAVKDILNTGAAIQCVELCDDQFMKATNIYGISERKYAELDSLFFKFQGTPETIAETTRIVRDITKQHGATGFEVAETDDQATDLWADRKNALFSTQALLPGGRSWTTDVCVPVSKLPELVYETKKDIAEQGLVATVIGHVDDGNFHALIMFDSEETKKKTDDVVHRMVRRAIALDGTCSGEHGIGRGKREFLVEELGENTVKLMKSVKQTIDPLNLFNPGKLFPEDVSPRK
ncbi:hypothetical protein DL93DRAFT_2092175 [Clavulina sp. PMI_390]|nr:hypothetical protein DL93DRAFT_2092175 [Clavulina sp. PMI_390]